MSDNERLQTLEQELCGLRRKVRMQDRNMAEMAGLMIATGKRVLKLSRQIQRLKQASEPSLMHSTTATN